MKPTLRLLPLFLASAVCSAAACGGDDEATTTLPPTGGQGAGTTIGTTVGTGGTGGSAQAVCGDGVVEMGEACDDGNTMGDDGCNEDCVVDEGWMCDASGCVETCGDGIIVGSEVCDDGNTAAGDGCDDACTVESGFDCTGEPSACVTVCGDGLVAGTEACDDGNVVAGDGCDDVCAVEAGYDCTGEPSVCDGICGDGLILGTETCDDSNTDVDDGCDAACQVEMGWACDMEPSVCMATCGDGLVNGMETCDDGNLTDADGCSAACQTETGYDCAGEPSVCAIVCGDGIIVAPETCDDGNMADGDGCSMACAIETDFVCTGEPSVCNPLLGDTCANAAVLASGANTINWVATGQDYITTQVPCNTFADPEGPDIVLEYTATVTGEIAYSIDKPTSTRWHLLVNDATCGDITNELQCVSEFSGTALTGTIPVTAGTKYYWYLVDSDSGANPLDNPVTMNVTETAAVCGDGVVFGPEGCDDSNLTNGDGCDDTCAVETGYGCTGEPSVCELLAGEDCANAIALSDGANAVDWSAVAQDYITSSADVSCSSTSPDGPDVVLSYTASATGLVEWSLDKPSSTRWHVLTSDAACGDISTAACTSEFTAPEMVGSINATAGMTYYFYVVDSTSGSNPLDDPLNITVAPVVCGDGIVSTGEACDDDNLTNGDGCDDTCNIETGFSCQGEPSTCSPLAGEDCSNAIALSDGANAVDWSAVAQDYITSSADVSCSSTSPDGPDVVLSYTASATGLVEWSLDKPTSTRWHVLTSDATCGDISTATCTSEFTDPQMTGTINATAGTTYYFYVVDSTSGSNPLDDPLNITVAPVVCGNGVVQTGETCDDGNLTNGDGCSDTCTIEQTCFPGVGGVVGNTTSSIPVGQALTEYYVTADEDPNGWVYVGGTSALYRVPKAGGMVEDVELDAGLTTTELGYDFFIDGANLFTLEDSTISTNEHFFRISTDGGANYTVEDFLNLSATPNGDIRAMTLNGGEYFFATHDTDTEIWRASPAATGPITGNLVTTVAGETSCSGLAMDDNNYYLACGTGERLVRVDRTSGAVTLLTDTLDMSSTKNELYAHDTDNDGTADVLYVKTWTEEVYFMCDPTSAFPYVGVLHSWGAGTGDYGMGWDRTANVLYSWDDANDAIIVIQ